MEALEALQQRVSIGVLGEPMPTAQQVEELLKAAVRAPDHGVLRPWRFLVLTGDQLTQLGEVFAQATRLAEPDAGDAQLEKMRTRPLRAPMMIVAVAETTLEHKVPVIEQVLATGAAVQNMLVAAHAMDIGAMWRTGPMASNNYVKEQLGFADKDEIVGFVYLGTPAGSVKNVPPTDYQDYLRQWP